MTGPFIAVPRKPSAHHTMGGVQINTNTEVLDTNGNVIRGLYAAGEVTGGIHGGNRLGGNAIVDTVVYGKTAGAQAAAYRNRPGKPMSFSYGMIGHHSRQFK